MREYIRKYRMNTGIEENTILGEFKEEQRMLVRDRNALKMEMEDMEKKKMDNSP